MGRDEHVCIIANHAARKKASRSLCHLLNFDVEDGHEHARLRVERVSHEFSLVTVMSLV